MQIEKYDRKPFSVLAVQVNFENINEVAVWCKGTVIKQKTKMLGVETEVPAIRVEGQGDNRGKSFVASLGCYVVELKGSFRVYKPAQFDSSFVKAQQLVGETVLDKALQESQKSYKTDISLLDRLETKAEGQDNEPCEADCECCALHVMLPPREDDNSSVDGQETAQTA